MSPTLNSNNYSNNYSNNNSDNNNNNKTLKAICVFIFELTLKNNFLLKKY